MDTDEPNIFDDEVIADSEEEADQSELKNQEYGAFQKASSISAFTTAGYQQHRPFSAISAFSGDASVLADNNPSSIEPGTSSKAGDKQADTSIISTANSILDGLSGTTNIADRAKMRQRSQKQVVSDVIELTSDDDDELSLKPSTSKAKSTKAKTKPKPKGKEALPQKAVTSTDTDAATVPKTKPRPRPRPIPKQPRYGEAGKSSSLAPDLPVATSPARITQAVSQLPPSDPPQYTEQRFPDIETLLPSSPNSLFNEGVSNRNTDMEVDELASDVPYNNRNYYDDDYISPRKMPPPPTFFAGSSSTSMGSGKGDELPAAPGPQRDVVDLTMLPPTMAPTAQKKEPKPKKQKKKKQVELDYDDVISAPLLILDEDEQDEDFDPNGDGSAKKKKGKAKEKAKEEEKPAKKNKAKAKASDTSTSPTSGGAQVEVVITTKPLRSKSKAKGANGEDKGKEAEPAPGGNKELFKSREFIDDSDDDDPMRLVDPLPRPPSPPSPLVTATPVGPSKAASKDTPIPAALTIRLPAVSSSRTPAQNPDSDSEMKQSMPSKSKSATSGKKRKTVVDSDEEDLYEEDKETAVKEVTSASKKRKVNNSGKKEKTKSKKKGRAKQVILSDEEEETVPALIPEQTGKPIERKKSKKEAFHKEIVDDEEANPFQDNDVGGPPPQKSTPEEITRATKENAAPSNSKTSSAFVTPRPSKPVTVNRDGTTPIYARYEIAPRRSSLPMSELIRRANSMAGSPFPTSHPSSASSSKLKSLIARTPTSTAYSPYLKSSRSLLSKIAPLHPNRRTPPPPPPPPPPRKKSKKELEMEEKWEEEMVEDVGGMEEWAALTDAERREMRKVKWAREQGGWDE